MGTRAGAGRSIWPAATGGPTPTVDPAGRPGGRRPQLAQSVRGLAVCMVLGVVVTVVPARTSPSSITVLSQGAGVAANESETTLPAVAAPVMPAAGPDPVLATGPIPTTAAQSTASTATTMTPTTSTRAATATSPTTAAAPPPTAGTTATTAAPFRPPVLPPMPPTTTVPLDPAVTLFPLSRPSAQSQEIVTGPDGNLWFTEGFIGGNVDVVGRITPRGTITEFHTPTPNSQPNTMVVGRDGNLWFTEYASAKIGRITTAGSITEFALPTAGSTPGGRMAVGPDGAVWFTERGASRIGRITADGEVSEFPLGAPDGPDASLPVGIVAAADGALWFAETNLYRLGRITTAGVVTHFDVPNGDVPLAIDVDGAGTVWYGGFNQVTSDSHVFRVDRSGRSTQVASGRRGANIADIIHGPDGAMWFSEPNVNQLGRIAPDGSVTEFSAPSPNFLADGPDGALWFASGSANAIGRLK